MPEEGTFRLPLDLAEATQALAREMTAAEPIARFLLAKDRFERDAAARSRVAELAALQARIRRSQAAGQVAADDLADLRAARKSLEDDRVTSEYWRSRRLAVGYVRDVNEAISRLLGVDFAGLAQRRGPC